MKSGARILLTVLAGALFLSGVSGIAAEGDASYPAYSVLDKAFYLAAADVIWVRPGLKLTIINVQIPSDEDAPVPRAAVAPAPAPAFSAPTYPMPEPEPEPERPATPRSAQEAEKLARGFLERGHRERAIVMLREAD